MKSTILKQKMIAVLVSFVMLATSSFPAYSMNVGNFEKLNVYSKFVELEATYTESSKLLAEFSDASKLLYLIRDIADYLFRYEYPVNTISETNVNVPAELMVGVDFGNILPYEFISDLKKRRSLRKDLVTISEDEVAVVPINRGDNEYTIFIALKDNRKIESLAGEYLYDFDDYEVKIMRGGEIKSSNAFGMFPENSENELNSENSVVSIGEEIEKLKQNGDINFWDDHIEMLAGKDPNAKKINVYINRGNNRLEILKFNVPELLLQGENRSMAIKYITASIYNESVCEGAEKIIVFMEDKKQERLMANAIEEELTQKYIRFNVYANFGKEIEVTTSESFSLVLDKELEPYMELSAEYEKDKCCIGVDVGGTYIKVVVTVGGEVKKDFQEEAEVAKGGEILKHQILELIIKARNWVERNEDELESVGGISALGITFPSPIKVNKDGSFNIVRMTNYERYWSENREGDNDFTEDYESLNKIPSEIAETLDIKNVTVLNDADAFGFGEIFKRISLGDESYRKGIKVVMPIGTGPGYVKIKNGRVEPIPNQGGHIVVNLNEHSDSDPGCGVKGCLGGYVTGSANNYRAKYLNFDVTGKDGFVPSDLDGAISLLKDMGSKIGAEAVKLHKITGADEIILAGGISDGQTGQELARYSNEFIADNYPEFVEKIKVGLSKSDLRLGGAVGAARYALAKNNSNRKINSPKWSMEFDLPSVDVGKGNANSFFEKNLYDEKKICLITTEDIDAFFWDNHEKYSWYKKMKNSNSIVIITKETDIDSIVSFVDKGGFDIIVPIGGGTVIDWGKHSGFKLDKEVVCIPSTLSGNGMFTEKAIFYRFDEKQEDRVRASEVSGPPEKIIFDINLIKDLLGMDLGNGITPERANRAGAGDILSIYPALLDWELAIAAGKEQNDQVIWDLADDIMEITRNNAEFIRDNTELGMILLIEIMAEASLLNMRYGTSRPKDGSEHLLADEIDKIQPDDMAKLHGEQVAIASLIMGYLYSTDYDITAYSQISELAAALGLPMNPEEIGWTKEMILEAIQRVRVRADKYTYFDEFGDDIDRTRAEEIYETVFGTKKAKLKKFNLAVCHDVSNSVVAMFEHITERVLPNLDAEKIKRLIDLLIETKKRNGRVIINAAGRIGEVAVFFQQKLRALGFNVDDFKEITPEFLVNQDDLVLTFSGSGQTFSVVHNINNVDLMHKDGRLGRSIFSVTATPDSDTWEIGKDYHEVMEIKGRSKFASAGDSWKSGDKYLPVSSTFEYSTMLFLEGIIEIFAANAQEKNAIEIEKTVKDIIRQTPCGIEKDLKDRLRENEEKTAAFIEQLLSAIKKDENGNIHNRKRIYLFGLGQNNYVIRLFARRIQNIGFDVYVPGPRDIISASRKGDIAIFVSNSGQRGPMLKKIRKAIQGNCNVSVITADANSNMSKECEKAGGIVIPISSRNTMAHTVDIMDNNKASRKNRADKRAFELASMFYFEGISVALMKKLDIDEHDLMHVSKEWELKGSDAEPSDGIIEQLVSENRMIEIALEDGGLKAWDVKLVEGYVSGETKGSKYRGDVFRLNQILSKEEQYLLKDWMMTHRVSGNPHVKFRVVLGKSFLKWGGDIEHSNISHPSIRTNSIYLGEKLLKYFFQKGHEYARTEILEKDEFAHLMGLDHGTKEEEERRLSLAQAIRSVIGEEVVFDVEQDESGAERGNAGLKEIEQNIDKADDIVEIIEKNNMKGAVVNNALMIAQYLEELGIVDGADDKIKQIGETSNPELLRKSVDYLTKILNSLTVYPLETWEDKKDIPLEIRKAVTSLKEYIGLLEIETLLGTIIRTSKEYKNKNEMLYFALELEWAKKEILSSGVNDLVNGLKKVFVVLREKGLENLAFIEGSSDSLVSKILKEMEGENGEKEKISDFSNLVILASSETIQQKIKPVFGAEEGKRKGAFMAAVDLSKINNEDLEGYNYFCSQIVRMIYITLELATGATIPLTKSGGLNFKYNLQDRSVLFWPRPEPYDHDELVLLNKLKSRFLSSL